MTNTNGTGMDNDDTNTKTVTSPSRNRLSVEDLQALKIEKANARKAFDDYKKQQEIDDNVRVEHYPKHNKDDDSPSRSMKRRTNGDDRTPIEVETVTDDDDFDMCEILNSFYSIHGDNIPDNFTFNESNPLAFAAINNEDTLTQGEMK
jgi:hypothetical protein